MISRSLEQTSPVTFADNDPFLLKNLPGKSAAMQALRAEVHRVNANVAIIGFALLIGDTGTGKNHVAPAGRRFDKSRLIRRGSFEVPSVSSMPSLLM